MQSRESIQNYCHDHRQTSVSKTEPVLSFQLENWLHALHTLSFSEIKTAKLKVENQPKQLLVYLPLDIPLPPMIKYTGLKNIFKA
jgi:hypothetical protein